VLVLEASRHEAEEMIRLSAYEHALDAERPVRHYDELAVSFPAVQQEIDSLLSLFDRGTNRAGILDAVTWQAIRAQGEILYTQLLTPAIRDLLKTSHAVDLLLYLDDTLVHIPWELLFDGAHFLCRRFSIGRSVSTAQTLAQSPQRKPAQPLHMLVVADPQGNLPAALQEGDTLQRELVTEGQHFQVDLRRPPVHMATITSALAQCDVLHYAGHAAYDANQVERSSWLLADSQLTAEQVAQLGGQGSMPALVFCNACQSGQTTTWQIDQAAGTAIYGLANAFLVAGTQHYIGTLWSIPDEPSALFAMELYRALARGATIGLALRSARQRLLTRYGADSVVWASYVLYGDPTSHYVDTALDQPAPATVEPVMPQAQPAPDRAVRRYTSMRIGIAATLCLVLGLGAWLATRLWPPSPAPVPAPRLAGPVVTPEDSSPLTPVMVAYRTLEQGELQQAHDRFQRLATATAPEVQGQGLAGLAAVAWARADLQHTEDWARQAERIDPEVVYSHVLRGHLLFHQGKTDDAMVAYRTATAKTHGLPWHYAVAYNRLGRLSTAQGDMPQALAYYDQALPLASGHPELAVVHSNKGYALATLGRPEEALAQYQQAMQINPQDPLSTMLLRDTARRLQLLQDREQQERIDKLTAELLQMRRDSKAPDTTGDDWTSRPLVLGFPPLQSQGVPSTRAGEDEVFLLRLGEALQAQRITIVERAVLDKILAELKLSTSALVQPEEAARVGRLIAARLMAIGALRRDGGETRLSLRVVDTETTVIQAFISVALALPLEREGSADQLVADLVQKLRTAYPRQGRLVEVTDHAVLVNLGTDHGVTPGLTLQVLQEDPLPSPEGQAPRTRRRQVGTIEIIEVEEARLSRARVVQHTTPFASGWKVREK